MTEPPVTSPAVYPDTGQRVDPLPSRLLARTTHPVLREAELQRAVIDCARWLGWRVSFTHRSDHSPAGYPDLTLVRNRPPAPPCVLWVELKSDRGRLSDDQRAWLGDLASVEAAAMALGAPALIGVYCWRPADWHSGEIERVLR